MHGRERCTGAVKRLEAAFYHNFCPVGVKLTPRGFKNGRRGSIKSGMISGSVFHRQAYHHFKCQGVDGCSCLSRFGSKTKTMGPRSVAHQRLKAVEAFLKEKGLFVFECELVSAILEGRCATVIDMICVDNIANPTQVWIVELKTGYRTNKDQASTFDPSKKMKGEAVKDIPNTYANHHQLQLWFEMESFEQTYHIRPTGGMVLYINKSPLETKRKKTPPYICTAEYARPWWYGNATRRRLLLSQFLQSSCSPSSAERV